MSSLETLSQSEIVARLVRGDEQLFTCVVRRYHSLMLGVAGHFTANRALAEEIVQETWMAVLAGLSRFEGRSSLKSWMLAILANRARTRASREARTVPLSASDRGDEPDTHVDAVDAARFDGRGMWSIPPRPWEAETPEALTGRSEVLALARAAIEDLPPRQRAVLTLRDVEHLEADEVCTLLDLSEVNQRVLLHRARSSVRTALERHLGRS
jgi:RNA polymerase sigma-70 factor (ECF subfamily)